MAQFQEARQPSGERHDYVSLSLATPAQLEEVMRKGSRPSMASMAGWEFRGFNTAQISIVTGRKFKKGFYLEDKGRDPALGICGYNVVIHQNALGEPWIEKTRKGEPQRMGWFDVYPVSLSETDNLYPNALLLNYGTSPKNLVVDPSRVLRDYVVQVYPDNPDLLAAKAYLALGPARSFISYFILERHNESPLG